jgi:hypothetical protein
MISPSLWQTPDSICQETSIQLFADDTNVDSFYTIGSAAMLSAYQVPPQLPKKRAAVE